MQHQSRHPVLARNAGLDLLRCLAILPVIVFHAVPGGAVLEQLGDIGVEIFFVLSGFLVAQMVFERFGAIGTVDAFAAFLANRWIRTFPLYFLFLGLNLLIARHYRLINPGAVAVTGNFAQVPDIAPYLVFLQNLTQGGRERGLDWFGVSWTLSIEEWFYVLFPCLLLLAVARHKTKVVLTMCGVLIGFSILARASRYALDPTLPFDDMYRRVLLFRLDTFCFGILAYLIVSGRARVPGFDPKRHGRPLFLAGGLVIAASIVACASPSIGMAFSRIAYLSALPLAVALMLPAFHGLAVRQAWLAAILKLISTRTYALYLCHLPVAMLFTVWIADITVLTLPVLLGLNLACADLIYRAIERPILRLRPSRVHGAGPEQRALLSFT